MKPPCDIYLWTCPNGHYFAMSSTGWLQPGSLTPPKDDKAWEKHFEVVCPFCVKPSKRGNKYPVRKLYKVTGLEIVTEISEEAQILARKALKQSMRTVRASRKEADSQYEGQRQDVLEQSTEET